MYTRVCGLTGHGQAHEGEQREEGVQSHVLVLVPVLVLFLVVCGKVVLEWQLSTRLFMTAHTKSATTQQHSSNGIK